MRRFRIAEQGYPYFITCTIVHWLPVFVQPGTCEIIVESLRYCREHKGLAVHCYAIMPTHLHLIVSSPTDLSAVLRDFKRHTSVNLVKYYEDLQYPAFHKVFRFCGKRSRFPVDYKVWQEGNHPEQIHSRAFFDQKAGYIHNNPVRKGIVQDCYAWTYSSARDFAGTGTGPLSIYWLDW